MLSEKKVGCVFHFGSEQREATAHLFEYKYTTRTFWFGVAQLSEMPTADIPTLFRIEFEDGRFGGATCPDGSSSPDYKDIAFVGTTGLQGSR